MSSMSWGRALRPNRIWSAVACASALSLSGCVSALTKLGAGGGDQGRRAAADPGLIRVVVDGVETQERTLHVGAAIAQGYDQWIERSAGQLQLAAGNEVLQALALVPYNVNETRCLGEDGLEGPCLFKLSGLKPGKYLLVAKYGDRETGRREISLIPMKTTANTVVPVIDRRDLLGRAETGPGMGGGWNDGIRFYAQVDPTCIETSFQFIWMKQDQVIATGSGGTTCPTLRYATPLMPVSWAQTLLPRSSSGADCVLVFQEGQRLVGKFKLEATPEKGQRRFLTVAESVTPSAVKQAQVEAAKIHQGEVRAFGGDGRYQRRPEPVVCAVVANAEAREAFTEAGNAFNSAIWAHHDTLESSARADDERLTEQERAKLRRKAGQKAVQHQLEREDQQRWASKLKRLAASYRPGCLQALNAGAKAW